MNKKETLFHKYLFTASPLIIIKFPESSGHFFFFFAGFLRTV